MPNVTFCSSSVSESKCCRASTAQSGYSSRVGIWVQSHPGCRSKSAVASLWYLPAVTTHRGHEGGVSTRTHPVSCANIRAAFTDRDVSDRIVCVASTSELPARRHARARAAATSPPASRTASTVPPTSPALAYACPITGRPAASVDANPSGLVRGASRTSMPWAANALSTDHSEISAASSCAMVTSVAYPPALLANHPAGSCGASRGHRLPTRRSRSRVTSWRAFS